MLAPASHAVGHQIEGKIRPRMVRQLHGATAWRHAQQCLQGHCKYTLYLARIKGNLADISSNWMTLGPGVRG